MGEDFPAAGLPASTPSWRRSRPRCTGRRIFRPPPDERAGPRHGGGVDRHLVGAGQQQLADVLDGAHAAADGERHEAGLRGAAHHVEDGVAVLVAGGDVEEGELVGAGRVIGDRRLDRIAGVAQIDELDALDDAAVLDVEAGDDADLEHICIIHHLGAPSAPRGWRRATADPAPRAAHHRARGRRWRRRASSRAAARAP